MNTKQYSILIADTTRSFADKIRPALVEALDDVQVIRTDSGKATFAVMNAIYIDLVAVNLVMGAENGADLIKEILDGDPKMKVALIAEDVREGHKMLEEAEIPNVYVVDPSIPAENIATLLKGLIEGTVT